MTTSEFTPGEANNVDGIIIEGGLEFGECTVLTIADGWKRREANLYIDSQRASIDGLEYEQRVPANEKILVYSAVAKFIRQAYPEVNSIEDPDGNLF